MQQVNDKSHCAEHEHMLISKDGWNIKLFYQLSKNLDFVMLELGFLYNVILSTSNWAL